jgi:hypothetical protein
VSLNTCKQCGRQEPPDARFCAGCGARLRPRSGSSVAVCLVVLLLGGWVAMATLPGAPWEGAREAVGLPQLEGNKKPLPPPVPAPVIQVATPPKEDLAPCGHQKFVVTGKWGQCAAGHMFRVRNGRWFDSDQKAPADAGMPMSWLYDPRMREEKSPPVSREPEGR